MSENCCQLCAVEKLAFEPPPLYCTTCGVRIKRNSMYYTMGTGDTRHYFCIPCYNDARTENIIVDGTPIAKSRLEKKKNDEETEEWVCATCVILLLGGLFICFINHLCVVYSGFNVISVKLGNTKFVPCLMVEEMMVDKLNTHALIATLKK